MEHLKITPLHASLGAEVAGVDLSGMTPEVSQTYMGALLDRMIRPEITYHHVWRKGDVLVIDDRGTMHRVHGDHDRSQSRVRWRIIVEGDRPRLA